MEISLTAVEDAFISATSAAASASVTVADTELRSVVRERKQSM